MSEAPARKQIQNTMYDHMEFPPYEFNEFPMAVPVVDGVVQKTPYDAKRKAHPVVIVNSEEELEALMQDQADLVPVNPDAVVTAQRVKTEDDERDELYLRAEQLGVKVDKRWSIERIQKALDEESDL